MFPSTVKNLWKEGSSALCTQVKSIDPAGMELAASLGFDCIWTDLEHGPRTLETFANLTRAARVHRVDVLARPAKWEFMHMGRILEAGAHGILYPRCDNAAEAREVVRWAKFSPLGERGYDGGNPDNGFAAHSVGEYVAAANERTWIAIQIESPEAVPHTRAIAEIEGVDCVFFGPGDYSVLTGQPGQGAGTEILRVAEQVARETSAAGKVFASLALNPEHARQLFEMGAQLVSLSGDMTALRQGHANTLNQLRTAREQARAKTLPTLDENS